MQKTVAVKVWDGWVRLFHWGIVACVATSYVSAQAGLWNIHYVSGYTALALVIFRIAWGLVGSENARFAAFLGSPLAALRELARFREKGPDTRTTHNPAGAWMVMLLLALLLAQATTGLFTNEEIGASYSAHGPFANVVREATSAWMSTVHVTLINLLLAAIAVHVLAAATYAVVKRHDLVRPMITGVKQLPEAVAHPPRHAPVPLGLILLAAAAGGVWALTRLGGGG